MLLKKLMAIKYNRIKDILDERGVRQKWLAQKLGMTQANVSRICANKLQPNLELLFKIADILNVHPSELLGDRTDDGKK